MEIISGFLIGILGSFHCLGMCGPIAMAVPSRNDSKLSIVLDSVLYNFGRTLTYTMLGALIGVIGASASLAGYQKSISIITGVVLLIVVLFPKRWSNRINDIPFVQDISRSFRKMFGKILGLRSFGSIFLLGLLNGLLPCGLVYIALTASVASGSVFGSATFMLFFGLGTLPMMASVFILKSIISVDIRRKLTRLIPVGISIVAVLLIMRGMSLNIPYISPVLPEHVKEKVECCD